MWDVNVQVIFTFGSKFSLISFSSVSNKLLPVETAFHEQQLLTGPWSFGGAGLHGNCLAATEFESSAGWDVKPHS